MELFLDTDIEKFFEIKCPSKVTSPPFWTAEVYSFGKFIRQFGRYPMHLPLCIYTDHGPSVTEIIYDHEIKCDAPVQFYHFPGTVALWRKTYKKPCYVLYSPFVFYRRSNKINQSDDAQGTLVYPAHTTPDIEDVSDIEEYIENIKKLPQQYHPLSICLHYHDVNKGLHKLFLKNGFRVFSAGHPKDYNFGENFYNILRQHKYSTSNMVMSCLFYSVEMGIPHFIYGNPPEFVNVSDPNIEIGNYDLLAVPKIKRATDMFQGPLDSISREQMDFVLQELGVTEGISRFKMSYILYTSYLLYFGKKIKNDIAIRRRLAYIKKLIS